MNYFYDTSAIVPLLIKEPHSHLALEAWKNTESLWAWRWMQLETEAALHRRNASAKIWNQWRSLAQIVHWLELKPEMWPQLLAFNRALGLRAADAAHLFICDHVSNRISNLALVTFDKEMNSAAQRIGLATWTD